MSFWLPPTPRVSVSECLNFTLQNLGFTRCCQVLSPALIGPEYIWSRLHQASDTHSLDSIYSAFLWGRYSRLLFGQAMRWNHVSISFGVQRLSAKPPCGGTQSTFLRDFWAHGCDCVTPLAVCVLLWSNIKPYCPGQASCDVWLWKCVSGTFTLKVISLSFFRRTLKWALELLCPAAGTIQTWRAERRPSLCRTCCQEARPMDCSCTLRSPY